MHKINNIVQIGEITSRVFLQISSAYFSLAGFAQPVPGVCSRLGLVGLKLWTPQGLYSSARAHVQLAGSGGAREP